MISTITPPRGRRLLQRAAPRKPLPAFSLCQRSSIHRESRRRCCRNCSAASARVLKAATQINKAAHCGNVPGGARLLPRQSPPRQPWTHHRGGQSARYKNNNNTVSHYSAHPYQYASSRCAGAGGILGEPPPLPICCCFITRPFGRGGRSCQLPVVVAEQFKARSLPGRSVQAAQLGFVLSTPRPLEAAAQSGDFRLRA